MWRLRGRRQQSHNMDPPPSLCERVGAMLRLLRYELPAYESAYAGTQAKSRMVCVGFFVLNTAFTFMPISGLPSSM